jgi:DtxR family Mn-dependent transcriptional regulator
VRKAEITPSLEDYLEAIFHLKSENELIRVTDLAQKLQVAKSSVNQAVAKLTARKLLTHERYGPLELTGAGLEKAAAVVRRHRLLQCFFQNILKVDRQTAERDACAIEHYISVETAEKLIAFLASGAKGLGRHERSLVKLTCPLAKYYSMEAGLNHEHSSRLSK